MAHEFPVSPRRQGNLGTVHGRKVDDVGRLGKTALAYLHPEACQNRPRSPEGWDRASAPFSLNRPIRSLAGDRRQDDGNVIHGGGADPPLGAEICLSTRVRDGLGVDLEDGSWEGMGKPLGSQGATTDPIRRARDGTSAFFTMNRALPIDP